MKNRQVAVLFLLALLTIGGLSSVLAQDAMEIPEVVITVTDDQPFDLPATVPEGVVKFTVENNRAEMPFSPSFARLNEGVTPDQISEALMSEDENAVLALITLYGGQEVAAGTTSSFWLDLIPGTYGLAEFAEDAPPTLDFFDVEATDAELPEGPESDVTVAMVDFAFGIPVTQAAGEKIWRLENVGDQWHEMAIFRLEEGMTLSDLQAVFEELMAAEDTEELPFEPAFFWAPMGADTTAWVTVDLEPGTYAVVCFLPDLEGDFSPHFLHGMTQVFTVE